MNRSMLSRLCVALGFAALVYVAYGAHARPADTTAGKPADKVVQKQGSLHFSSMSVDGATMWIARAKVPGGWLIASAVGQSGAVTFYPDPEHKWDGTSLP